MSRLKNRNHPILPSLSRLYAWKPVSRPSGGGNPHESLDSLSMFVKIRANSCLPDLQLLRTVPNQTEVIRTQPNRSESWFSPKEFVFIPRHSASSGLNAVFPFAYFAYSRG